MRPVARLLPSPRRRHVRYRALPELDMLAVREPR
jgi:hypothetical protein